VHPRVRPSGARRNWRGGYLYSSWQLLLLGNLLTVLAWKRQGLETPQSSPTARDLTLALCALSPRFLPGVLGSLRLQSDDSEPFWRFQAESHAADLLATVGFPPEHLAPCAETLLVSARMHDPMVEWLRLLRHAPYSAWRKMQKAPLHAMWGRTAAELLLRAHEELADDHVLRPLGDLTGETWYHAQHDRLSARYDEAAGLDRALSEFGLSPHPRVLLLLEGDTEMQHVPRLLADFDLGEPSQVRVQNAHGVQANPSLIARYGITPRVGRERSDGWDLLTPPTALMIAMDPEHQYRTPADVDALRHKLAGAIREEVQAQGADIAQDELDQLVDVRSWGDQTYELANFSDDELVEAITQLAQTRGRNGGTPDWESSLRADLIAARGKHQDIKIVLGPRLYGTAKVELAELLWPVLRDRCAAERASGTVTTPVLQLVYDVQDRVAQLDHVSMLSRPAPGAEVEA
jgi:hypothetical protein